MNNSIQYIQGKIVSMPDNWNKYKLADVVLEHKSGIYKNRKLYGDGANIVGVSNLYNTDSIKGQFFRLVQLSKEELDEYALREGDLIYGESSLVREGIARTLYVTQAGEGTAFAWHTRRFSVNQNEINSQFLNYLLNSTLLRREFMRVATQTALTGITTVDFFGVMIAYPQNTEQIKIAEILGKWDEGIEKVEKLIDAKKRLKKGLMQQLLTGKKRFKEFKGQEWKTIKLREFGDCIRGVSYKPDRDLKQQEDITTVRLLRSNNIQNNKVLRENMQYVAEERCNSKQFAKQNDILICMSNGSKRLVGKTACFDVIDKHRYTVGAFCAIYRTNSENNSDYINQLFNSENYRKQLWVSLAGTNINNLKNSDIESLKFSIPTDELEQQRIASVLNAADKEIDLLNNKLEALNQQKKGLMQKLLTGIIRVKV